MAIVVSALSGLVYGGCGALPVEAAPPDPSVRSLQRQLGQQELEQRERQLEQRDAVIEDLQRRVQELERRTGGAVKSTTPKAEATTERPAHLDKRARPAAPTQGRVPGEEQKRRRRRRPQRRVRPHPARSP